MKKYRNYHKYSDAALKAATYIIYNELASEEAWERSTCEIWKKGDTSQTKSCPRCAFLGLIQRSTNIGRGKNAKYALDALEILKKHPDRTGEELWNCLEDAPETHNGEMNVLLALWNKLEFRKRFLL